MDCFYPGRILVGPGSGSDGPVYLAEAIEKDLGNDFEYAYGIEDILRANELKIPDSFATNRLPFVARVPEGAEVEFAARIAGEHRVGAAIPDYLVRASSPITFHAAVLDTAIAAMGAEPGGRSCGTGCVIGVLDSGFDPSNLSGLNLHPVQYDALDPRAAGKTPNDGTGHGTLVSRIIGSVAPGAKLISIKALDDKSTVSSVLAALYLAQAAGPCDVLNLSLSVSCSPTPCQVCQAPTSAAMSISQLAYFFDHFMQQTPSTILVAAAGNNTLHLALPAAFDRIIAVGSFDYSSSTPLSSYHQVPSNRYIMAGGGQGIAGEAFAERAGFKRPEYLYGTSFASAFVTGFAARAICKTKFSSCGTKHVGRPAAAFVGPMARVIGELDARALRKWSGYDASKHGMGAVHF